MGRNQVELSEHLNSLIEKQSTRRFEATAARAELSRALGRLITAEEFERAVGVLKSARTKELALSERRTRTGRWLSLYTPKDEKGLYPLVTDYLKSQWLVREEHGLAGVRAGDVAETWSKGGDGRPEPDMLAWIVTSDETARRIQIISFEVKPDGASPLEATKQASSQRNFVSFAYLVQQIGSESQRIGGAKVYEDACREYGLGLIVFGNASDFSDFSVALRAERNAAPKSEADFFRSRVESEMAERAFVAVGDVG